MAEEREWSEIVQSCWGERIAAWNPDELRMLDATNPATLQPESVANTADQFAAFVTPTRIHSSLQASMCLILLLPLVLRWTELFNLLSHQRPFFLEAHFSEGFPPFPLGHSLRDLKPDSLWTTNISSYTAIGIVIVTVL
jgi:hypothetical protein